MKINLGKLARLAARILIVAPAVVTAVKPVLKSLNKVPLPAQNEERRASKSNVPISRNRA